MGTAAPPRAPHVSLKGRASSRAGETPAGRTLPLPAKQQMKPVPQGAGPHPAQTSRPLHCLQARTQGGLALASSVVTSLSTEVRTLCPCIPFAQNPQCPPHSRADGARQPPGEEIRRLRAREGK